MKRLIVLSAIVLFSAAYANQPADSQPTVEGTQTEQQLDTTTEAGVIKEKKATEEELTEKAEDLDALENQQ